MYVRFWGEYLETYLSNKIRRRVLSLLNSVSREGMKYRYEKGDWAKSIQPVVNRVCEQMGLSLIDLSGKDPIKQKVRDYKKWETKGGHKSWSNLIRQNLDEAIQEAKDYEAFLQILRDNGYQVREGVSSGYGSYLALKPEGAEKAKRNYTLGDGYSVTDIKKRILDKDHKKEKQQEVEDMRPYIQALKETYPDTARLPVMGKFYYRKALVVCIWNNRLHSPFKGVRLWRYRKDLKEVEKHMENLSFTVKYDLKDTGQLDAVMKDLNRQIKECLILQKDHRGDPGDMLDIIREALRSLRKEIRIAQRIKATYRVGDRELLQIKEQEINKIIKEKER